MQLSYSFIIPVYNRPQEIRELLDSILLLDFDEPFEIVIVEDGSTVDCVEVIDEFRKNLNISYYYKENSGPGDSRNFGMKKAHGNYFLILDSDCILPKKYLTVVDQFLKSNYVDCFGGADAAHSSFTALQKAINYTMTSFFTTGGIRGSKKGVHKFEPRSFNMGLSKKAFEETKGFSNIHPGEDPDLSRRIMKAGFRTAFVPNAEVYHKRRISWSNFYLQVRKFGMVRPILNKWHPDSAKITFWFPTFFILFVVVTAVLSVISTPLFLIPLGLYAGLVLIDSTIRNQSLVIGFMSVIALFIQFFGYGTAFLKSTILVNVLKKDPEKQFPTLFFK
ncbi:MAG: glycosyltransferase [Flavobacteriaceae bacterium]|nr:glycosyltransferase [Flavobacteriaceae bacterium]